MRSPPRLEFLAPALACPAVVVIAMGADLVDVTQVDASLARFGERYLRRVYTPSEVDYCLAQADGPAPHLAARFAAKEATIKALRPVEEVVGWRSVEVRRRSDGASDLVLHGSASALAARRGIRRLALSMSHDGHYAMAVVVAQARGPSPSFRRFHRRAPCGAYER